MSKDTPILIQKKAVDLFKEKGFNKVTIDEICLNSGITKSTFYYHFPTKEHLLFDFLSVSRAISPETTLTLATSENYWEKLWACLEPTLDWAMSSGSGILSQVLILCMNNQKDFLTLTNEDEVKNLLIGIIEKGQENGQFGSQCEPVNIYRNMKNSIAGIALEWCMTGGELPLKETVRESISSMLEVRHDLVYY